MTEEGKKNIIPFGKYKGRTVEEIQIIDSKYLGWLSDQPWLREKFGDLYLTIVNYGAESQETPEHNALQILFVDDEFCLKFLRYLIPGYNGSLKRWFEHYMATDVVFSEVPDAAVNKLLNRDERPYGSICGIGIEIKPTVGDDYPAIVRQMLRNGSTVLFLEQYIGVGATREQFIKFFSMSKMKVVFLDEVNQS